MKEYRSWNEYRRSLKVRGRTSPIIRDGYFYSKDENKELKNNKTDKDKKMKNEIKLGSQVRIKKEDIPNMVGWTNSGRSKDIRVFNVKKDNTLGWRDMYSVPYDTIFEVGKMIKEQSEEFGTSYLYPSELGDFCIIKTIEPRRVGRREGVILGLWVPIQFLDLVKDNQVMKVVS